MNPTTLTENNVLASITPWGAARSTIGGEPLAAEELAGLDAYWRASLYLCAGMIYLRANPLLREPLQVEHTKKRLLGHWGSDPGMSFVYTHLNRLIKKHDLDMMFIAGPGHGAPALLSHAYLEGTYSEIYPECSQDERGLQKFFKQFSFPGGIGSHCTPETPGSIHEGGELGYSLSHAFGTVFDHPELITTVMVGDGEAETGPLATAWHSNKFLNPVRDGAVLPILHLNGYKINNPTILARITHEELDNLFRGYGYTPCFVEGSERPSMHQALAATLEHAIQEIKRIQADARRADRVHRPRWPVVILRTPKGWTCPAELDGHRLEGVWRSHQVPIADVSKDPKNLQLLAQWLESYQPHELFDAEGKLVASLRTLAPVGSRRMSANPVTNGGLLRRPLRLPDFGSYQVAVKKPGTAEVSNTHPLGEFLRDAIRDNPDNFRVFGPDEITSNKLDAIFAQTKKVWLGEFFPEDADGAEIAVSGQAMEMLSEHTLEGWLEGYLLSGRHGFLATYEAFAHVIDSMVNQHCKWLEISRGLAWRAPVSSLNLLITSTVWRQDHNGFTHQDPGFLDVVMNKSPDVVRVYLPPDVNCLLSVADHCLRSTDYVNVIVSDKQKHLQYLDLQSAIVHCTKGIGIWKWASTDEGVEPDLVLASCGDIPTLEALAASVMLREAFPDLKIRFINVVDLLKIQDVSEHPHGLSAAEFDGLFTPDKPVIFNFHGYPWIIHRLAYRRTNHANLHVHGYREKGNIDTPLELAIRNGIDRFTLAMEAIARVPRLSSVGAHAKEHFHDQQIRARNYAFENGADSPEIAGWKWPC